MDFIIIYISKLSAFIALTLKAPWAADYIFYLLLALTALIIISIAIKILKAILSPLLKPIYRLRGAINEQALSKSHKKAVLKNIKRLLTDKDYKGAAGLYLSIDEFGEAAKLFVTAKEPTSAAELYERIENFEKAAMLYKEADNRIKAAELFVKINDYKNAAQMYEMAGLFKNAAELYEKVNDYPKAAELYERCFIEEGPRRWKSDAGQGYAYLSGKLYEKAGDFEKAINIFLKDNFFVEAALLHEKRGKFINAGECYLKGGNIEKAAESFRRGGDLKRCNEISSQIYYQKGQIKEAALFAEQAGNFAEAAEKYTEAEDFAKAGELYLKAGCFNEAGEIFIKIQDFQKAADAFEKGGNYIWAARAYDRVGDTGKVTELYERGGDYLEAGRRYKELGLIDKAVNALQRIDAGSDNYVAASVLIGEIFLDKGIIKPALERFQKIIGNAPLNKSNIEPYYYLGICYEKSGDKEKAKAIYDRILAEDYHFKDVVQRSRELTLPPRAATPQPSHEGMQGKRYQLLEEIGRGGMGIVYKARDTVLKRIVAYKLLSPVLTSNPIYLERFVKEARLSANLNHTNIVTIFDTGQDGDDYYITMEYIEGKTIKEHLTQINKFKVPDAVKIAKQICRALAYAHNNKVVHRDIKPSNIMISRERMIKIMDFGVAKVLEDATRELTSISGTPLYMSPEQITGKGVDYQSDIYSFGVTLFELVIGRPPFTDGDLGYHHLHSAPPSPKDIDPSIPDDFSKIIVKCLEKDKAKRYKKTEEILTDLDKVSI